jgi:hypothetical protein
MQRLGHLAPISKKGEGELKLSTTAGCQNKKLAVERDEIMNRFSTKGIHGILMVASCDIEVIVAWSLLPFLHFSLNYPATMMLATTRLSHIFFSLVT